MPGELRSRQHRNVGGNRLLAGAGMPQAGRNGPRAAGLDLQRQAWQWAVANRGCDGSLPSGKVIAARYGRHERWGSRLVKRGGIVGEFADVDR
jgi:hypothetical protein